LRFEKFNLGWNLGLNYVSNNINKAGLAFGLSTDIFISKEINFSSSINWSEINHQPVNSFDIKYKYFTKRFSINVGYQYLKIATPTYSFLSLGAGVSL
jgi:long-subunit fatty acid transport protein